MSIKTRIAGRINHFVKQTDWYRSKFKDCQKFWNYNIFNTDVVNLGSTSGVHAFDYSGLPIKGANWALSPNPLNGDLAILKNYYSYLREDGATVILPLCPFSSMAGSYNTTDDRYYTLLYPSSIPCFSQRKKQQVMEEMSNPIRSYPLFSLLSSMRRVFRYKKRKPLTEYQLKQDAQKWMISWEKEFGINDFVHPLTMIQQDNIEEAAEIIREMKEFCRERGIRLVLLLPPVYHTLGELLTPDIRKIIIGSLLDKVKDDTLCILDYMDLAEFSNTASYFHNSFLLSDKGAKVFTHRVLEDINLLSK